MVSRITVLCQIMMLLCSCSGRSGNGDSGLQDAFDGTDGQVDVLRVGSADTFEIATWNIRNFPSAWGAEGRVADLIERMDIDLVAVQEIADVEYFEAMLGLLESHDGVLSEDEYGPGEYQKTGFVYRKDIIDIGETESLFEDDGYAFPRPPLQARFTVTNREGEDLDFYAIVVHLKAELGEENEARRRSACEKLEGHVNDLVSSSGEGEVFVVGDFNDLLDDQPPHDVFEAFLSDTESYRFLTRDLAEDGEYSLIPWRNLVDHLLITTDLLDDYHGGRTSIVPLDQFIGDYDYVDEVSDHRPVVSVFPF